MNDTPPELQANAAIEFIDGIDHYTDLMATHETLESCYTHFRRLAMAYMEQEELLRLMRDRLTTRDNVGTIE